MAGFIGIGNNHFYRTRGREKYSFTASFKNANIFVKSDIDIEDEFSKALNQIYSVVENYASDNPFFSKSFLPLEEDSSAPDIIKKMYRASRLAGVGPDPDHPGQPAGGAGSEKPKEGADMMVVTVSHETSVVETRDGFNLTLPKFLWTVLESRAKALHGGDLQATVTELVADELLRWFSEASRKVIPVPAPSPN